MQFSKNILKKNQQQEVLSSRWRELGKKDPTSENQKKLTPKPEKFTPLKNKSPLPLHQSNNSGNPIQKMIERKTKESMSKCPTMVPIIPSLDAENKSNHYNTLHKNSPTNPNIVQFKTAFNRIRNSEIQKLPLNSHRSSDQQKSLAIDTYLNIHETSKSDMKKSFDISRIDDYNFQKNYKDYIISNDSKSQIYRIINLCKDRNNLAVFDKIDDLKTELQYFRRDIIKQMHQLKEYSLRIIKKIIGQYKKQVNNVKQMQQSFIQKCYEDVNPDIQSLNSILNQNQQLQQPSSKISTKYHTFNIPSVNSKNNNGDYQSNVKKHQRVNTQQLEFYKSDQLKNFYIQSQLKYKSTLQSPKQLKQPHFYYSPLLGVQRDDIKTQRAKSFEKIFQTLQKLKHTVEGDKIPKVESLISKNQKFDSTKNKKNKPILKKNTKYCNHQMLSEQNLLQ